MCRGQAFSRGQVPSAIAVWTTPTIRPSAPSSPPASGSSAVRPSSSKRTASRPAPRRLLERVERRALDLDAVVAEQQRAQRLAHPQRPLQVGRTEPRASGSSTPSRASAASSAAGSVSSSTPFSKSTVLTKACTSRSGSGAGALPPGILKHANSLDTSKVLTLVFRAMSLLPSSARTRRRLGDLGVVARRWPAAFWGFSLLGAGAQAHQRRADGSRRAHDRRARATGAAARSRPQGDRPRRSTPSSRPPSSARTRSPPTGSPPAALRTSATRAEWARGDIPVYPYPASERRDWTLNFSLPGPRQPRPLRPAEAGRRRRADRVHGRAAGAPASGAGSSTRSSRRRCSRSPRTAASRSRSPTSRPANVQGTSQTGKARLSPAFFLIPFVLLGLVLADPGRDVRPRQAPRGARRADLRADAAPDDAAAAEAAASARRRARARRCVP